MSDAYALGKLTRTRADGTSYWSYCIKWWEADKRRRYSLDTTDKPTAEALARKLWAERTLGTTDTVGTILPAYLDSLNGLKDERRKRECWKAAQGFWNGLRIALIDDEVSRSYMVWRQRSQNTMRNELSLIRTALNWAEAKKLIDKAPKIVVPAIPPSSVGHLTKPAFKRFLAGCHAPHVRLFAILAVTTGARKAALLEAKWEQVDWLRMQIDLNPVGRAQNSKGRAVVALNDPAMQALREAKAGAMSDYVIEQHGLPIADIKKGIAAAAVRSGIKAHPHMFRHSAAVWMAEDRVPMAEIASFLGHRDMNITIRVYARYHPDYLRTAARSLTW